MDGSPVTLSVNTPERIANWRPLVHWFLAIPHLIVVSILGMAASVVAFISFFAILFTGAIPEGLFNFQAMVLRYQWRTNSYVGFLHEAYPPFTFDTLADDPGDSPAVFAIEPPENLNRFLPLVKWLMAIPHFIVLYFLSIVAGIAGLIAFFAVLFTGKYPEGIQRFIVGFYRWQARVFAYILLLTDSYPPFSLE
jgi:hypothetical protein